MKRCSLSERYTVHTNLETYARYVLIDGESVDILAFECLLHEFGIEKIPELYKNFGDPVIEVLLEEAKNMGV